VEEDALVLKTIIAIEITPSSIANHKHNPKLELLQLEAKTLMLRVSILSRKCPEFEY
jgi:hypothetical protein